MKKTIIISVLFDVSMGILMGMGIVPSVWWPVLVGVVLQIVIAVIIDWRKKKPKSEPGCRHLFDEKRVTDLNDDPPCVVCGKYFSLITMQEWVKVTPVTDEDTWVNIAPRDKLYKTVPRNDGQRQQPQ